MRIVIEESAIDDFNIIAKLAQTKITGLGNFIVDIHAPVTRIIAGFHSLACQRPKLKKLGIYCQICLSNISAPLAKKSCLQILTEYVYSIGWDDLQYISFFEITLNGVEFHLIFNRVTPEGQLIDLSCLGATSQQYDILRRCCSHLIKSLNQNPDYSRSGSDIRGLISDGYKQRANFTYTLPFTP
ncbi:hypothetical protein [Dendronalium sp. ChiSLP03b]|uniref:hypothetical protein n=1 Tax=Dendronalium sp. ChiSLP03b TaxID=3075381 RepID=UPI002AD1D45C|nr:hypothetical protein [Dendronalium sp. ChiSLP03b]MDZ8203528.1 hypothetical protein [Dendronalium sp. ChiSLP03b]